MHCIHFIDELSPKLSLASNRMSLLEAFFTIHETKALLSQISFGIIAIKNWNALPVLQFVFWNSHFWWISFQLKIITTIYAYQQLNDNQYIFSTMSFCYERSIVKRRNTQNHLFEIRSRIFFVFYLSYDFYPLEFHTCTTKLSNTLDFFAFAKKWKENKFNIFVYTCKPQRPFLIISFAIWSYKVRCI